MVKTLNVKMLFEGKKLANGQNIDYSEKRKRPKGFICPCTGVKYHNIQTCLLVYAADSGERLQDHWSSGFMLLKQLDYDKLFLCYFQYSIVTCRTVPGRVTSVSQGGRPGQQDFVSYTGQVSTSLGPVVSIIIFQIQSLE